MSPYTNVTWSEEQDTLHPGNTLESLTSVPGGGEYSLIWAIWGRAAGQGMVFGLAVLNRVYNLTCLCPKQGMVLRAERL